MDPHDDGRQLRRRGEDGRDEGHTGLVLAAWRGHLEPGAGTNAPGVPRRERQRQRDGREIGDTEQFGVGRDGLAEYGRARGHMTRDRCAARQAVERTTAAARSRDLLAGETQRDLRTATRPRGTGDVRPGIARWAWYY